MLYFLFLWLFIKNVNGRIYPRLYIPNPGDYIRATSGRVIFDCNRHMNCVGVTLICGKYVSDCLLNCDEESSCQNLRFVSLASGFTRINCLGKKSCIHTHLQCGHETGVRQKCQLNCGVNGCNGARFRCIGEFSHRCTVDAPKPVNMAVGLEHFTNGYIESTHSLLDLHCIDNSCNGTVVKCSRPYQCYCGSSKFNGACAGVQFGKADPTISPSSIPSKIPSFSPTKSPSIKPTRKTKSPITPTIKPTRNTKSPISYIPTLSPSTKPSNNPTDYTKSPPKKTITRTISPIINIDFAVYIPKAEVNILINNATYVKFDCSKGNCVSSNLTCGHKVKHCVIKCGIEKCEFTKFKSFATERTDIDCSITSSCVQSSFLCGQNEFVRKEKFCNVTCGIESCEAVDLLIEGNYKKALIDAVYIEHSKITSKVSNQAPIILNCQQVGSCLGIKFICPSGNCRCTSPKNNTYCKDVKINKPPTKAPPPTIPRPTLTTANPTLLPTLNPSSPTTNPTLRPSLHPTSYTIRPTNPPTPKTRTVIPHPGQIIVEKTYPYIKFDCTRNYNCIGAILSCTSNIEDCSVDCGVGACDFLEFNSKARNNTKISCNYLNSCYQSKFNCGDEKLNRIKCSLNCGIQGCKAIHFEAHGVWEKVEINAPNVNKISKSVYDNLVYKNAAVHSGYIQNSTIIAKDTLKSPIIINCGKPSSCKGLSLNCRSQNCNCYGPNNKKTNCSSLRMNEKNTQQKIVMPN